MSEQRFVRFGGQVLSESQVEAMLEELMDDTGSFVRSLETAPAPCLRHISAEELAALEREREECW